MSSGSQASPFYLSHARESSAFAKSMTDLFSSGSSGAENLRHLANNTERFLRELWVPRASNLQFLIDNVTFQASYAPEGDGVKLQLWATLGYLPYSVESHQRRRMLLAILEGAHALRNVHFGLNRDKQIIVTQTLVVPDLQPPAFIFVALVLFLQESRPFITLIGACL
jgi:hypothetical protein